MIAVWAHRGASRVARENTVDAFAAAVRLGADGVELDVRFTADGALAVHHDPSLPDGRLVAATLARDLPPHVPQLDAALDACGDLVVNIEIKEPPALAEAVVAEVRNRGMADRVVVSCFDLATVDRVRAIDPGIPTGYLVVHDGSVEAETAVLDACRRRGHGALHPHEATVGERLATRAAEAGVALHVWTVDDRDRIRGAGRPRSGGRGQQPARRSPPRPGPVATGQGTTRRMADGS